VQAAAKRPRTTLKKVQKVATRVVQGAALGAVAGALEGAVEEVRGATGLPAPDSENK